MASKPYTMVMSERGIQKCTLKTAGHFSFIRSIITSNGN